MACGISTFFNYEVSASGRVVYLTGEDAEEAVHHRLWAIHHRLCPLPESDVFRELLAENMAVVPLVGWDARFVKQAKGELVNTRFYQDTLKNLTAIEGLKLVIIDPVSRFFGADENDAGAATYFTSLLERIAKETGATVLACHHLNKANGRDGGKASLSQHSSRGSTGFMAAARWVLAMATITEGESGKRWGSARTSGTDMLFAASQRRTWARPSRRSICSGPVGESWFPSSSLNKKRPTTAALSTR